MRYFTKELNRGDLYLPVCWIEEDERAAVFSEEYFQMLYAEKLQAHLEQMRGAQKYLHKELSRPAQGKNINLDMFEREYEHTLEYIKWNFPTELLEKVADQRILALGVVAPGLKQEFVKYSASFGEKLCEESEAILFSEEYFQKTYARKLEEYLQISRDLSAAFAQAMQKVYEMPFDEEEHTQNFRTLYESRLAGFIRTWPEELLAKVADVRVLGLFVAAPEVKMMMAELEEVEREKGRERHARREENAEVYHKQYRELLWKNPGTFLNDFDFHDVGIQKLYWQGEDLVLELGGGSWHTQIKQVVFEKAEVETMEEGLAGACWLYEEVYEHAKGFEIHVLAHNSNCEENEGLAELVLYAKDVRYAYNKRTDA